jgi:SM-20-related protein
VSVILYLNEGWSPEEGGALRLYLGEDGDGPARDIPPVFGRMVVFWSERFFHEVLPAGRERMSLTGWLRTRE